MNCKHSFLCCLLLAAGSLLQAQSKALVKEDALMFGDTKDNVTKASIQAETEKTLSVQAEYKGFDDKSKSFKITATILNQLKKPMKEFEPQTIDLDQRGGVADFTFSFTQRSGIQYAPEGIRSSFIEFSIAEKKQDTGLFSGTDLLGLGSKKFLFQLKKTWKVKVPTTVQVKLVPYKSAAAIRM